MKEKGFTLVELLAVIVILALIALIITPTVLNIINHARRESQERSVELYATSIRNGIVGNYLNKGKKPRIGIYDTNTLPFEVEYEGDIFCNSIHVYKDGNVYLNDCAVNGQNLDFEYGKKQEIIVKLDDICTPAASQPYQLTPQGLGYKYSCEVAENDYRTFFVLSKETDRINLIMDSNINELGQSITSSSFQNGIVAWYADSEVNNYGPVTAMEFLQRATSGWTYTSFLLEEYDDRMSKFEDFKIEGRARLPRYNEMKEAGANDKDYTIGSGPVWLRTNLFYKILSGYWLFDSSPNQYSTKSASRFYHDGIITGEISVTTVSTYGVRPVITLSI